MGDAILKQFIEKDQLFHFLMGLDQVLAQKPVPNISEAYGFIHREELREATMLAHTMQDSSALVGTIPCTPPRSVNVPQKLSNKKRGGAGPKKGSNFEPQGQHTSSVSVIAYSPAPVFLSFIIIRFLR